MDKPKSHSKALEEFRLAKFDEMTATINALTAERDALKAELADTLDKLTYYLDEVGLSTESEQARIRELIGESEANDANHTGD